MVQTPFFPSIEKDGILESNPGKYQGKRHEQHIDSPSFVLERKSRLNQVKRHKPATKCASLFTQYNHQPERMSSESAKSLTTKLSSAAKPNTRISITIPKKNKRETGCQTSGAMKTAKLTTPHVKATSVPQKVSPTPSRKMTKEVLEQLSSKSLPPLPDHVIAGINDHSLQFRTNAEPCALQLSPTGRLLAVAFTDGTVRLFDMTGRFKPTIMSSSEKGTESRGTHCSYTHQRFGAVAVQLEAKGVHRSLLIQVDVSPDSQWFFAGALRGSMEMAAIYIGDLEATLSRPAEKNPGNLLDLIKVFTHSDAKLRGFEACTCLQTTSCPQYLLLSGRGIKNCHVWRFVPPSARRPYPLFEAIMNLPTNGTTVKFLHFREKPFLQVITKSDDMKIQVWDLRDAKAKLKSSPETLLATPLDRPNYQDVPLTESALGIAGSVCLCGGSEHLFNTLSVVNMDDRLSHATELALPGTSTNRRRSRGDLQSVASVATLFNDADHALLQLSDDSLVWFKLANLHPTLIPMTEPGFVEKIEKRKVQIRRVGYQGTTIAVSATFDSHRGVGKIQFKILEEGKPQGERFWGYLSTPLNLASDQSPISSKAEGDIDISSFGTMEVDDDDDGSKCSGPLKVSPKPSSTTPSLPNLQKQSIVTPQTFELKQEPPLERPQNSALRPLARQLTQSMPFASAKKAKKSKLNIDQSLKDTNEGNKRSLAAVCEETDILQKKRVKVDTSLLDDLAAASILKSIGQLPQPNATIATQSTVIAARNSESTGTEAKTKLGQLTEKHEAIPAKISTKSKFQISQDIDALNFQKANVQITVDMEKQSKVRSLSPVTMSPPVPRKKSSSNDSDTLSEQVTLKPKNIDVEGPISHDTSASRKLTPLVTTQSTELTRENESKLSSDFLTSTLIFSDVKNVNESMPLTNTPALTAPISKGKNDLKTNRMVKSQMLNPPTTKVQKGNTATTKSESKASCKIVNTNSISKRCSEYIAKLQIELDKLGPHKSRLLTTDPVPTDDDSITGERRALMDFTMRRALRMAIAVLKSVHMQPSKTTWLEAKSFLDDCFRDLNISWKERLNFLQLEDSASLDCDEPTEAFAVDISWNSFCQEKLGLSIIT